jgi:hypothetical protein
MWLLTLLAASPEAAAAGFQAKTMRAPMSAVEVERPLVIGKGWLEASFGYDQKLADGAWSSTGEAIQWESARWLYTTERIGIRYGFTRSTEFYWDIPFHYARLVNDKLGTDTEGFGIGEPKFGWKWELFNRTLPNTSIALDLQYKMPTGQETAGTYVGGPNTFNTIPMSTGQADLAALLRGKRQFGPLAVEGSIGWVNRFSGVSQFVVEVDQYQFAGRFKPGSEVRAELSPMVQLGPVAVHGDLVFRRWFESALGTTAPGFFVDENLDPIAGSDGWSVDAGGGVVVNCTRGVDVLASASVPVRGEDLLFFPLEGISPTRGTTLSASLELRY